MKDDYKPLIKLSLVLLLFYTSSLFSIIPIYLFNIDINNCNTTLYNILRILPNIGQALVLFFMYRNEIVDDFKKFINNFGKYSDIAIKYWIIGFIIMFISNMIIINITPSKLATNEEGVREIIKAIPLISVVILGFVAPFSEEIIFRKSFKDVIKTKWVFILTSGFVFGLLHVITSFDYLYDLLYVIPYSSLGIAFALIYYRTNNVFSSIFVHALHNTILVILNIFLIGVIL